MPEKLSPESQQLLSSAANYEKLSVEELVTRFYIPGRLYHMQIYAMLLRRNGLPLPLSIEDWQLKSRNVQLTDFEKFYRGSTDAALVWLGMVTTISLRLMQRELYKRFDEKPIGLGILMEEWKTVQERWITKRRLKCSATREDTIQDGMRRGLEVLETVKLRSVAEEAHQPLLELPMPAFPFPDLMDEFETRLWNHLVNDAWPSSLDAALKNVVPLVRGEMEASGRIVDNFLLKENRKLVGREALAKENENTIRSEVHPDEGMVKAPVPDVSERMFRVLKHAKKRWGPKAVKALRHLFQGKTEIEAAGLAGISPKTVQRYKEKLKKDFS